MKDEANFMGKKPVPPCLEVGDRVKVIDTVCCPEYLGKTGTITDTSWEEDNDEGEIFTFWVTFDVDGDNHGYTADKLEKIEPEGPTPLPHA